MNHAQRDPSDELEAAEQAISRALGADRYRFRRRARRLRRQVAAHRLNLDQVRHFAKDVHRSVGLRETRQAAVPAVEFPDDLPIVPQRRRIAEAIADHQVVVVCGDTGSGKSTQLPKICLEMGRGVERMIGHTQPRRIAARTVAARVASELQTSIGELVGYKIRFSDATSPKTFVKLMTDGILLAETSSDPYFDQYDTLILDEAHERSLNIDFLLGYIKRLLPKRPDLRCIVTSATIDPERIAEHFATDNSTVPIIQVSGRAYPVEVEYQPQEPVDDGQEPELASQIVAAIENICARMTGDVLVFLPTERAIRDVAKTLGGWNRQQANRVEVLPLYARLPASEQNRIFAPHSRRRVVLATNVAESSLTVPGIRAVVDTGTARIRRYSPRSKVERLPVEAISRASADQRMGRCGRVGPGLCVRLYSAQDYLSRDPFTTPEIRRANLANVILQTLAYRLGDIDRFPFVDPPRREAIRDGYKTLYELGAIDQQRRLTPVGRALSRLPVDPRIGRMILAAEDERCLDDMLIIGAALEAQDPRDRPADKTEAADNAHQPFIDERSDFAGYLKLWDFYHHLKDTLSRSQLRRACRHNFLSFNRLREWADIYRQLRRIMQESGRTIPPRTADTDAIHRALLTGLLSGIAYRTDQFQYTGAGGAKLFLWPGSALFQSRPLWITAAEQVETSKRYARTVAKISPEWIEPIARHLIKYTHEDPHWSRRRGAPMIWQHATLFGLPVVARRRVPLGPVDADAARQLFIDKGLVEGDLAGRFAVLRDNAAMIDELAQVAARSRRADWMVTDEALFEFYHARLPADVFDTQSFRQFLKRSDHAKRLRMCAADFESTDVADAPSQSFPDAMPNATMSLPLDYCFEPGNERDGVTVTVPQSSLNQITTDQLEWLVPGHLVEKITALIRSLPKSIRRTLVPAPDTARRAAAMLEWGKGPFLAQLAHVLGELCGETIPVDAFQLQRLPNHLVMKIEVVDDDGQSLTVDTDLSSLRREYGVVGAGTVGRIDDGCWNRSPVWSWEFGDLPEQIELRRGGLEVTAYPTLVVDTAGVAARLVDTADRARAELRSALRSLYQRAVQRELRTQLAYLPHWDEIRLLGTTLPDAGNLDRHVRALLADRAFLAELPLPRTEVDYHQRLEQRVERIGAAVQDVAKLLPELMRAYHRARVAHEETHAGRWRETVEDVERQMTHLTAAGFMVDTPWLWLQHYPRYFAAIDYRLDRLRHGTAPRDAQGMALIKPWLECYAARAAEHAARGVVDPELVQLRWMLEELRVSLFAQPLGTCLPVSEKRLQKQWAKVAI